MSNDNEPPRDAVDLIINAVCVGGGFALIAYLKFHYGSDLGDWLMSLIGY